MNKKSLAFRLGIYILTTVSIVIVTVVLLNFTYSKKILIQRIEESASNKVGIISNRIAQTIITTEDVTQNVASQVEYYKSHGDLKFFLKQVLDNNPTVSGIHLEFQGTNGNGTTYLSVNKSDNDQIVVNDQGYSCFLQYLNTNREKVLTSESGAWSDPFFCTEDSTQMISFYHQVIRSPEGEYVGVIFSEINMVFLDEITSGMDIDQSWSVFILDYDGKLLAYPEDQFELKSIDDVADKFFSEDQKTFENLKENSESTSGFVYPDVYNKERTWVQFAPIANTRWYAIILVPSKDLFHDLDVILRESLIVSIVGILVVLLVLMLIFRRMLLPLSSIVRSIQSFSFGNLQRTDKKNEVELLTESLLELQQQYSLYIEEQSQNRKDRKKYEKDLRSAKEIQTTIVPNIYPPFPDRTEIDLFATLKPAESIGGDLYDYFFVDSNHLLFTMGDVSGKGIPAALFMAVAHTLIKSKADFMSVKHIMEQVNNELSRQNYNQHFLTLFLGILDVETGILSYSNAAHNYPFLIKNDGEVTLLENTHGLPLGVYSDKTYSGDSIVLKQGDKLVLYTDGVTDCKNSSDIFFGMERLKEQVTKLKDLSVPELIANLLNNLKVYRGETRQIDDISLMAIEYKGKNKKS